MIIILYDFEKRSGLVGLLETTKFVLQRFIYLRERNGAYLFKGEKWNFLKEEKYDDNFAIEGGLYWVW